MHASSLQNMHRCFDRYVRNGPLELCNEVVVLDVGGAEVNGSYREVFADSRYRYITVDVAAGAGVDIVLDDPYRLPVDSGSVDVVVSGQMLEHCEFFWLTFAEMMRVLKPDGYLFLIAPSAGPIHRYPVDCYRFYPDAYHALAKFANCHLIEVWLDELGPWCDLVGVFAKHTPRASARPTESGADVAARFDPVRSPPGTADEETTRGELHYLEMLATLHKVLEPSLYLEIGVRHGRSLELAQCPAVGVDPAPALGENQLRPTAQLIPRTSDEYFASMSEHPLPQAPDFVFIDGMHLFENALRDFMHIERLASPATLVAIDDICPCHPAQAERERRTRVWTGDVWRLHRCLAEKRPDLILLALDTAPTGLLLVSGLDPTNRVLWNDYNPIVRQYRETPGPPPTVLARDGVVSTGHRGVARALAVLRQSRDASRDEVRARMRAVLASEGIGA